MARFCIIVVVDVVFIIVILETVLYTAFGKPPFLHFCMLLVVVVFGILTELRRAC